MEKKCLLDSEQLSRVSGGMDGEGKYYARIYCRERNQRSPWIGPYADKASAIKEASKIAVTSPGRYEIETQFIPA